MSVRYATITAMRAAPTSGFNAGIANTCYVDSVGDFFNFKLGSTTPDVSNIVVSSSDALGKWHRMGIPPQSAVSSVLLYDATGTAVATANSGTTAGRTWLPLLIEEKALAAVSTYTTPTWTAGAYRTIWIELDVSSTAFSYVKLRVNSDSGNNYDDNLGNLLGLAATGDPSFGANGYAKVGILGNANPDSSHHDIYFNPLTTGRQRFGRTGPNLGNTGVSGTTYMSFGAFAWKNTASDVTSLTLFTDVAVTGKVSVWGVPA